jgi:hypothetical protein
MKKADITPQMIEEGTIFAEVYPMKRQGDDFRMIMNGEKPDFYDVAIRPAAILTPNGTTDPIEEWEELSLDEASKRVALIKAEYTGIDVDWIDP